jgi:hypothetical protein
MISKPDYTIGEIRGDPRKHYYKLMGPEDLSQEQLDIINKGLKKGWLYLFVVDQYSPPPKKKKAATFSRRERDVIYNLTQYRHALDNYSGLMDRLSNDDKDYVEILRKDYFDSIIEAVRAGLIWHPWVYEFVYTNKAFGNKKMLRKIKRGWETGVKRPLTMNDIKFESYLDRITEYRRKGKTWKQIRRVLMKRKIVGNITWQGLRKKYERALEKPKAPTHLPSPVLIPPLR